MLKCRTKQMQALYILNAIACFPLFSRFPNQIAQLFISKWIELQLTLMLVNLLQQICEVESTKILWI